MTSAFKTYFTQSSKRDDEYCEQARISDKCDIVIYVALFSFKIIIYNLNFS
jgi:hypothetical protein